RCRIHLDGGGLMRIGVLMSCCALLSVGARLAGAQDTAPAQGQWTMPAGDYSGARFTRLNQITRENVKDLKVEWTFDTGVDRGQEAAPLVVGDTMYVVTPFPNILYALDLSAGGTMKWKYDPKPEPAAHGVACCDVVCRGCSYWDGGIYYN